MTIPTKDQLHENNEAFPQWLRDSIRQGKAEAAAKEQEQHDREERMRQADKEHALAAARERYLRSGGTEDGWEKDKEAVYESVLRAQAAEAIAQEERHRQAVSDSQWRDF